jgi:hypothetical protein
MIQLVLENEHRKKWNSRSAPSKTGPQDRRYQADRSIEVAGPPGFEPKRVQNYLVAFLLHMKAG